jgi:hypothetical protein
MSAAPWPTAAGGAAAGGTDLDGTESEPATVEHDLA